MPDPQYPFKQSAEEMERLRVQAKMYEPFALRMFEQAGLTSGMRVLDLGSGAGDLSFLAASMVGANGQVTGIDRSTQAVETAQARALQAGLENVQFLVGDASEMKLDEQFDAIVGRLVLMYFKDPAAVLQRLSSHLGSKGIVALQEFDILGARSYPAGALFEQCIAWAVETFERAGIENRMGLRLYWTFISSGLPAPSMQMDAIVVGGKGHVLYSALAEVIRSISPLIEKFGIATAAEVDIESLRDRLETETVANRGVIVSPSLVSAWARLA